MTATVQPTDIGSSVRELRFCRGFSQVELASLAKTHPSYVGAIERGEVNPNLRTLGVVAGALKVELSSLIRLAEERAAGREMSPEA